MIKFFRQIQQRLLKEKRLSQYMLYALGEIILVVIGILIALQINNWNESRKTENEIKASLHALKNDLIQDTLQISERLPFIEQHYLLNESLRNRVAGPQATVDTLVKIMRFEFNPNWVVQIPYNTNSYNGLVQSGLIEGLPDQLKTNIKRFYSDKTAMMNRIEKTTNDYQGKVTSYVNTYTFGTTSIHDQGPLIDSLVWSNIDYGHLAATFQGISNFKRILFNETKEELDYSFNNSRDLILQIENHLNQ